MAGEHLPTEGSEVPNLDAMEADDLWLFWCDYHEAYSDAGNLFPKRPRGYVKAAETLAQYALYKATAIKFRLRDDVYRAAQYEAKCEVIYLSLPQWARW